MIAIRLVAAWLLVTSLAGPAMAESKAQSAERLYEEGVRFYNLTQYDNAIDSFQQAYLLSGQSGLLFNIAQAYRQENRCADALKFYRNYLRAEPKTPTRDVVERHISEMEACAQAAAEAPVTVAPVEPAASPTFPTPAVVTEPQAVTRGFPWMWTLGAAGVALAAGGTALLVSTSSGLDACSPRCSPDRLDDLRLRAGVGYGLLGGAGVSLAAAAWLWLSAPGRDSEHPEVGVSIGPSSISMWSTF